jgi:hypothetical protein
MAPITPLEIFRTVLGMNPLHFYGLWHASLAPVGAGGCDPLVAMYQWQAINAIGRIEVLGALESAERKLQDSLGYAIGARYTSVEMPWPTSQRQRAHAWYAHSLVVPNEAYIQALGTETRTAINLAAAVVYSDQDNDTYNETFTIQVATAITDPAQIVAYVAEGDQVDSRTMNGEEWRITPIKVTIAGGIATITGSAWLLVRPILYEGMAPANNGIDAADPAVYLQTLSIYSTKQSDDHGTVYYDASPWPTWCCFPDGDPAGVALGNVRGALVNPKAGIINPVVSVYNSSTAKWSAASLCGQCRPPDRIKVNVLAGLPRMPSGAILSKLQRVVIGLAVAELDGQLCGCTNANRQYGWWQHDISRTTGPDQFAFKEKRIDTRFGTKRGQIDAANYVIGVFQARSTSFG